MPKLVGVDVGGTFTDLFFIDTDRLETRVAKVPSTPKDQSVGMMVGIEDLGVKLAELSRIVHGTTVATNALIERKGAKCGLITTSGFRDVLEMRRRDRPKPYGLKLSFEPLIPRYWRLEVSERTTADGQVLACPSRGEVEEAARTLLQDGVEAVVVSFLHSYRNPANELTVKEVLNELWPNPYVVVGHEVLSEFREFERTTTATVNAYVQPLVDRYLRKLEERLGQRGFAGDILVVQSNGGLMSLGVSRTYAVNTICSGPAAGVIAALELASAAGHRNVITCDMGGTSLDVALITDGTVLTAPERELEYGLPIRVPMVDVASVGAGGGSVAWIDAGGYLQIGPESAGADPGPACYGKGGTRPTVTDANVVLGRVNPKHAIGLSHGVRLEKALAEEALAKYVGEPLGISCIEAASAVLNVAGHKAASSIRLLSIERGYDPNEYVLFPFGGAGPLHAASIMRGLGMRRAIIPYFPGVTAAMGALMADMRHDFVQSINTRIDNLDAIALRGVYREHVRRGLDLLRGEGVLQDHSTVLLQADMRYEGQTHVLPVPIPPPRLNRQGLTSRFNKLYRERYGFLLQHHPVELVALRTTVVGVRSRLDLKALFGKPGGSIDKAIKEVRKVHFDGSLLDCPIYQRDAIPAGTTVLGPAIIEQVDTTTVLDPGFSARPDELGNMLVEVVAR